MGLLFGGRPQEEPVSEAEESEISRGDRELTEEAKARIEDMVGLNMALITPTRVVMDGDSSATKYHKLVNKDFKISNITKDDVRIVRAYQSVINHIMFLDIPTAAAVFHSELEGFLASQSSVDGFERKSLITAISNVVKTTKKSDEGRRRFF